MLLGIFVLRKKYELLDYGAALMFCFGLCIFTLADKSMSPVFDITGASTTIGIYQMSLVATCAPRARLILWS